MRWGILAKRARDGEFIERKGYRLSVASAGVQVPESALNLVTNPKVLTTPGGIKVQKKKFMSGIEQVPSFS